MQNAWRGEVEKWRYSRCRQESRTDFSPYHPLPLVWGLWGLFFNVGWLHFQVNHIFGVVIDHYLSNFQNEVLIYKEKKSWRAQVLNRSVLCVPKSSILFKFSTSQFQEPFILELNGVFWAHALWANLYPSIALITWRALQLWAMRGTAQACICLLSGAGVTLASAMSVPTWITRGWTHSRPKAFSTACLFWFEWRSSSQREFCMIRWGNVGLFPQGLPWWNFHRAHLSIVGKTEPNIHESATLLHVQVGRLAWSIYAQRHGATVRRGEDWNSKTLRKVATDSTPWAWA